MHYYSIHKYHHFNYIPNKCLCKEKDRLSVEWSLKGTNLPIGVSSYELGKHIHNDILEKLPTEEEINLHIDFIDK